MSFSITAIIKQVKGLKPYWIKPRYHCVLCLASIPHRNPIVDICQACKNDLPLITSACTCCHLPLPITSLCGQCIKHPPLFYTAITPYQYKFPIDALVREFKYQSKWTTGRLLADLLIEHLTLNYQHGLAKPDYLIYVPQTKKRLRTRGFNQAEMLSTWLAKKLNIPLYNHLITRIKHTQPQQQLTAKERAKNLKQAFSIDTTTNITGLHIALVDDVLTTGSTANAITQLLLQQGAKRIDVYAIARTSQSVKLF